MTRMKNILIVNPFGIGDVLFTTPLIAALKQRYPASSLSYLGNARTAPFLRNDTRLDKVFCYERDDFVAEYRKSPLSFCAKWISFVRELHAGQFDTAFDFSLGSPLSLALFAAGVPRRIGFDYKGRGRWLTDKVPLKGYEGRHVSAYYLDLLGLDAASTENPPMSLALSPQDEDFAKEQMKANGLQQNKFVVIHPGGGESWGQGAGLKRWSAVNFAKLADKMVEMASWPIILMGGKNDRALCEEVALGMRHKALFFCGQASISQTAALMRNSRVVIANDGGPLHMAVAAGARTVSIFGPVDPAVYGPYPSKGHLVVRKGLRCQPCYQRFRMSDCQHQSCLRTLSCDEVVAAIQVFLRTQQI